MKAKDCDFKQLDPLEGIDIALFNAFTTRAGQSSADEEEQWCELWMQLFPDDNPSDIKSPGMLRRRDQDSAAKCGDGC